MNRLIIISLLSCISFGCKKSSTEDECYATVKSIVVDYDAQTPVANATVYSGYLCILGSYCPNYDSTVSDALGIAYLKYDCGNNTKLRLAFKNNYIIPHVPYFIPFNNERIDTIYIARTSFVNFTIHKTGTYLPGDSIALRVIDYTSPSNFSVDFRNLIKDKTTAPDRTFNLYTWYHTPFYDKLYFQWDIIRNGSVLSTKLDSVNLIQFGTQNFTLNY